MAEEGLYVKAQIYMKQSKVEDSLRVLNQTLEINPEHLNALRLRGSCLNLKGKPQNLF